MAGLLALIFTLLVLPVIFLWSIYSTFFNSEFYRGDFVDVTYDFVLEEGPKLLNIKEEHEFAAVSENDLRDLFRKIFSKEDVAEFFDSTIENFIGSLGNVENQTVKVKVSLNLLSKKREAISTEIANLLYERLPKCDQANDISGSGLKCVPSGLAKIDFVSKFKRTMDMEVFARLQDELMFDFGVPEGVEGDVLGFLKQAFSWLFVAALLFLSLDLFLLGIVIMGPWYKVLHWEAKTVLIPSIVILLFSILLNFSSGIFEKIYLSTAGNPDEQNLNLIKAVLDLFLGSLAGTLFLYAIPAFVISFGLWIAAVIYERKHLIKKN